MTKMMQFNGTVIDVREKSCLMRVDGVTGWVPDSLTDYIDEPVEGEDIEFIIPAWLALKKGFID